MRVLIWCDTYYQLISAINMKTAIFANCEVDVVLSDHSSDAERVVERLRAAGVFDSATFAQTREVVYGDHKKSKLSLILRSAFGKTPSLSCEAYDEIVFYGLNPWLYGIGDESVRKGKNVRWSRFDEGILSYDTDFAVGRIDGLLEPLRRMARKYAITDSVDRYYCYFPELKNSNLHWGIREIPLLNKESIDAVKAIRSVFGFDEFPYTQKYLFFASSSDIDGEPFGETEIVLKLAEAVGPENLLVKMHPRDTRDIYRNHGITVMENSQIPWEVVQLCSDMRGRVLLTVTSGAFLSASAMSECPAKAAFIVPDCADSPWLEKRVQSIGEAVQSLHRKGFARNVKVVQLGEDGKSAISKGFLCKIGDEGDLA